MPKIGQVITASIKPVLVEFQNGKVQPGEEKSLKSALFADSQTNEKIVGVASDDMVYSGVINNNSDLFNNYLVLKDPLTKKFQLIQVDTCTVAPLAVHNPVVKTTPVKTQSLGDLQRQFGSKKAKRYTEQQERLAMNIENVKEHLEKTVEDINVSEITTTSLDATDSFYKPKINREASSKEQVYQLSDLVPTEVLNTLGDKVSEILESEDMKEFELLPAVEKYMLILRSSSFPESVVVNKCKILLFINYLVHFMITPLKSMTRKFVACNCSAEVDKHIKETYMINGTRPVSMRDKGLCYSLVLLMLAMEYEADLEPFAKDLKTGLKKMIEFARNLGFSLSSKNKSSILLKIPVPPPIMPHLKRKRSSI